MSAQQDDDDAGRLLSSSEAVFQDRLFQSRQLFLSPNVFTIQPLELPVPLILNKTSALSLFLNPEAARAALGC
jgi:hypothetical protein